ncbi:class I SAM-dependent methyltransferase [Candidatus Dependentiae bacterium]|nr:class I SAM-dependent methyltransferase [Candidatus Dependentiae bacterium]
MTRKLFLFFGLSLCTALVAGDHKVPQSQLYVIENESPHSKTVIDGLKKCDINFTVVDSVNDDSDALYIICDISKTDHLPQNYIAYQSLDLSKGNIASAYLEKLSNAIAVWDYNLNNIARYQSRVAHYYYFPTECEYIDPIFLVCALPKTALSRYRDLLAYSNRKNTDISSHLPALFCYGILQCPKIIVEAGVRGGESTIPFKEVAAKCNSQLIGIDIEVDVNSAYAGLQKGTFLRMNDLAFASYYEKSQFRNEKIDMVFIDTSHQYEHTLAEIQMFAPMLSKNGMIIFHDSNVTPLDKGTAYIRLNYTKGQALGNTRGVTRALKEYFAIEFDEHSYLNFKFPKGEITWRMIHYPFCNGLTIVQKVDKNL